MAGVSIPLDADVHFDAITSDSSGAAADADATPTWAVYEEATDTPILSGDFTKRTGLAGHYRGQFTASTANGFEIGRFYSVIGQATVDGITGKCVVLLLRVVEAAATAAELAKVKGAAAGKVFRNADGTQLKFYDASGALLSTLDWNAGTNTWDVTWA